MKLSTRSRYGTRALVHIAKNGDSPMRGETMAEEEGISKKYLDSILMQLRKAALLKSFRGPGGGYLLAQSPCDISMADIVRAMEGTLSLVPCVENPSICKKSKDCHARKLWCSLTEKMEQCLSELTLADVAEL